jgi:hypothetical protein
MISRYCAGKTSETQSSKERKGKAKNQVTTENTECTENERTSKTIYKVEP